MAKAKKRRAKKRQSVKREERCAATPETLVHLAARAKANGGHAFHLQVLLSRGPENNGLSASQFEAALNIVEGFDVITHGLGYRPMELDRVAAANTDIGPKGCRLWNIYLDWGRSFERRALLKPHVIVEVIKSDNPISAGSVWLLALAADMWERAASDYDKVHSRTRYADAA